MDFGCRLLESLKKHHALLNKRAIRNKLPLKYNNLVCLGNFVIQDIDASIMTEINMFALTNINGFNENDIRQYHLLRVLFNLCHKSTDYFKYFPKNNQLIKFNWARTYHTIESAGTDELRAMY